MLSTASRYSGIQALQQTFDTASTHHELQQTGIDKPNVKKTPWFYATSVRVMCVTCTLYMLCRLLMAAGIAGVPSLTANKGAKEFIRHQESWWNRYTECMNFSKRTHQSKRRFKFQVQTDGISVSVLMFRPFPTPPLQANTATPPATPPPPGRKRKRIAEQSRAAGQQQVNGFRAYLIDI